MSDVTVIDAKGHLLGRLASIVARQLLAGKKPAWDRFVTRYARVVYAAVHRRLGPAGRQEEAEDLSKSRMALFWRGYRQGRRVKQHQLAANQPTSAVSKRSAKGRAN